MRPPRARDIPVLILEPGYGGLGAARSLGRLGIPVYAVRQTPSPVLRSRYWRGRLRWRCGPGLADDAVLFLQTVQRRLGAPVVLLPTTDQTALLLAEHAETLGPEFLFPRVPADLVRALVDKRRLHALARAAGMAVPRTATVRSRREAAAFLAEARLPVIAKAADPGGPMGTTRRVFRRARALLDYVERLGPAERSNLLLQEFLGGEGVWMVDAYLGGDGQPSWVAVGMKLRQHPAPAGVASLAVVRPQDRLAEVTVTFLRGCGYRGLVDVDYAVDPRDGTHRLLDVNPRLGATFRLFTGPDGMDLARAYYLDLTGQPVPGLWPVPGRRWWLEDDVAHLLAVRRPGEFWRWLRSLREVREAAWAAPDDPLPLLARVSGALWRGMRRGWHRSTPGVPAPLREVPVKRT
jgi:predicted ATP-grasp superfamily ATP-dependent carboligase